MTQRRPLDSNSEILIPNEVAEILRVSRRKINQLVAEGQIPCVRIGKRRIRYKREAIMKWFREQHTTDKSS
jgi:excisionase family DNA binding protein